MKSCAISRRATVLGWKRWALAVCLVQAAGHRPCSAPLSGMPLGIVVVVVVDVVAPCAVVIAPRPPSSSRRAFPLCPSPSSHAVVVIAIRRRRHRRSVVVSPCPAPLCTIAALSCRCRTAGSAVVVSLRRLRRRAVGRHRRGATGRRCRFVFASPGLPL